MTLTISEIKDLAQFAGLRLVEEALEDADAEITVEECPAKGVEDDDGSIIHSRFVAYFEDCREDGCYPLGPTSKGLTK